VFTVTLPELTSDLTFWCSSEVVLVALSKRGSFDRAWGQRTKGDRTRRTGCTCIRLTGLYLTVLYVTAV
jgi:hypothetical protein